MSADQSSGGEGNITAMLLAISFVFIILTGKEIVFIIIVQLQKIMNEVKVYRWFFNGKCARFSSFVCRLKIKVISC